MSRTKKEEKEKPVKFTGVARSVQCVKQQSFNNFQIVTLLIEDGIVKHIEKSEPFASWETIAKLEIKCHEATLNLNHHYESGKAWQN